MFIQSKAQLFENINREPDSLRIAKNVLNSFGERSDFPLIVDCLLGKQGTSINEDGCSFPGDLDEDELYNDYNGVPFEGVNCWYFDEEEIVLEDEFFSLLKQACQRYIELHPEKREELEQIMSQSTLI